MTQAGAVGIVAGEGRLPLLLARRARAQGRRVVVVEVTAAHGRTALAALADDWLPLSVPRWEEVVSFLLSHKAADVYLAGKVAKARLFREEVDEPLARALDGLPHLGDGRIGTALVADLERRGLRVGSQGELLPDCLPEPGLLGGRPPSPAELADVACGLEVARALAGLDVGQTVVVKRRTILAVEAVEGTDEAIRRGGRLGGPGATVVKMARPGQDPRFDLPAVGPETIRVMAEVEAAALAIEAGRTLLAGREETVAAAAAAGIALLAVDPAHPPEPGRLEP